MIPIPYFLVLFSLLMMLSGCSQTPPPKFNLGNGGNQVIEGEGEPQKLPDPKKPVVKPNSDEEGDSLEVQGLLRVKGKAAETLFQLLALESQSNDGESVKKAKHYRCSRNAQNQHDCLIHFAQSNGQIVETQDLSKSGVAELTLDADLNRDGLTLKQDNQMGQFQIIGNEAKQIFFAMTNPVENIKLLADQTFNDGTRKKGFHINCTEQFKKSAPQDPIYTCNLYFKDRTTGEFELIQ